ncbi:Hypothetical_protein [Hexamita inflata]|uniref:Hypothetical_protein n=1 Tax=Hexamita inflata TaxID=28002 RepID=A0AA86VHH9_9EUKA|nr:Hypothetical protein HINF_LOCUS54483 [Hexamita inflata]
MLDKRKYLKYQSNIVDTRKRVLTNLNLDVNFDIFVEYCGHKHAGSDNVKSGYEFYVEQRHAPLIRLEPIGQVHTLFKIYAFVGHQQTLLQGQAPATVQTHVFSTSVAPVGHLQLRVIPDTVVPEFEQE